jgi:hypothetical protein
MVSPELITYIRNELARGVSKEEIEKSLMSSGWAKEDIEQGMMQLSNPVVAVPPPNITVTPQTSTDQNNTKTIVTVILLLFFTPVGLILMWFWTRWAVWVKILVSILFIIPLFILIPVMAAIVLVAVNPSRQFLRARDTNRRSDIAAIVNAVSLFKAENKGKLPASIKGVPLEISSSGADICKDLVPIYLSKLPVDPSLEKVNSIKDPCPLVYETKYFISVSSGKITVSAPSAESGEPISISR